MLTVHRILFYQFHIYTYMLHHIVNLYSTIWYQSGDDPVHAKDVDTRNGKEYAISHELSYVNEGELHDIGYEDSSVHAGPWSLEGDRIRGNKKGSREQNR